MCKKTSIRKNNMGHAKKVSRSYTRSSIASLRVRYTFWILFGTLILAGIALVLRVETPVVWTFLYGIGGWAALTNNLGRS